MDFCKPFYLYIFTAFLLLFISRYNSENLEPESEQDKIDLWFSMFSECVGYNLVPTALFWGIPLGETVSSLLEASGFVPFLPDDEITRCEEAKSRVCLVKERFSDLIRMVDEVEYCREKFQFSETDPVRRARALDVLSWSVL